MTVLWNDVNAWLETNALTRMGAATESTYPVRTVHVLDRPWDQEPKAPTGERIELPYVLIQSAEKRAEIGEYACRAGDVALAGYEYTIPYLMAIYVVERDYGSAKAACRTLVRRGMDLIRYARYNGLNALRDSGETEMVDDVQLVRGFVEDGGWQTVSGADSAAYFYLGYVEFNVVTKDI